MQNCDKGPESENTGFKNFCFRERTLLPQKSTHTSLLTTFSSCTLFHHEYTFTLFGSCILRHTSEEISEVKKKTLWCLYCQKYLDSQQLHKIVLVTYFRNNIEI